MPDSELLATARGPVCIAPMERGDLPGVLELFRTVFGVVKTPEVWAWQFDNELSRGRPHVHVGRERDGRIVAHFASIVTRFWVKGKETLIGQSVDAAIHPDYRDGLRHRGLFAATVQCHSDWCGQGRLTFCMGLPVPASLRIGRRFMGYVPMMRIHLHARALEPARRPFEEATTWHGAGGTTYVSRPVTRFSSDADHVWLAARDRIAAAIPRDARHLNWRYADAPGHRYRLIELRHENGDLVGMAVGLAGYRDAPDGVLAEWFAHPDHPQATRALLEVAESTFAAVGMRRILVLSSPVAPQTRLLEERGYALVPTHYTLVSHSWDRELCPEDWLNRNWYYTLGDFDVV